MRRHRTLCIGLTLGAWGVAAPAWGQTSNAPATATSPPATTVTPANSREAALLQALQANPTTAPYQFRTEVRGSKVALVGRVGSKYSHDVAIQTAIAMGVPVYDALVIDTRMGQLAANAAAGNGFPPPPGSPVTAYRGNTGFGFAPPTLGPGLGYTSRDVGFGYGYGPSPYANYPSLFGLVGDPFYGFEPPAISYPPWWGALTAQRMATNPAMTTDPNATAPAPIVPGQGGGLDAYGNPAAPGDGDPAATNTVPSETSGKAGDNPIEMSIDGRGVATLRGSVPTLADRIAVGQQLAKTEGVTEVVNLLTVRDPSATSATTATPANPRNDNPPPPPMPAEEAKPAANPAPAITSTPAARPIEPAAADGVAGRAEKALRDRPALANAGAKVKVRDGIATLSGTVPTAYEAMLAYRAVQQTPGVREVDDRLSFAVPDEDHPNPLPEKGRPEDVEPYLAAQIRRQVGDVAHIDAVKARGESLEVRGTLGRESDRDRFDAILRSMPLLRGFKVESLFTSAAN